MDLILFVIVILAYNDVVFCLNNGLALTPPMGWITWQRFRCTTDCHMYPYECISENLILRTADQMVSDGYKKAGYEYLIIDDCWMATQREPDGVLNADPVRFPNGMKYIADYVHSRGLKLGIYQSYGERTCAGYPGMLGYELKDVLTFANWNIDYIKLDGCFSDEEYLEPGFKLMEMLLNMTFRPIVFSCSWPAYVKIVDLKKVSDVCNLWRLYDDIDDNYNSLMSIINYFGDRSDDMDIWKYAKPGAWNDPDMLIVGNFGLSLSQARVQMAIWAILASPLLISADLKHIKNEFKKILLNDRIIAVNQDRLGLQGARVHQIYDGAQVTLDVWYRELSNNCSVVAFLNRRPDGIPYIVDVLIKHIPIVRDITYLVEDLYGEDSNNILEPHHQFFSVKVDPSSVKFYKLTPKQSN